MIRRGILSAVYSILDPLGFIAPYVTKAKLPLQTLSRTRFGWDDPLEEADKEQWKRWLDDLLKVQELQVDRCFKPKGFGEVKEVQLHLFSDAFCQGYVAVAYFRFKDVTHRVHCAFVIAKARLAPVREIFGPDSQCYLYKALQDYLRRIGHVSRPFLLLDRLSFCVEVHQKRT